MPIRSEIFESGEFFSDKLRGATRHESASRSDYPEKNPKQWGNVKISRFHGALIPEHIYRPQLSATCEPDVTYTRNKNYFATLREIITQSNDEQFHVSVFLSFVCFAFFLSFFFFFPFFSAARCCYSRFVMQRLIGVIDTGVRCGITPNGIPAAMFCRASSA